MEKMEKNMEKEVENKMEKKMKKIGEKLICWEVNFGLPEAY